MGTPGYVLRPLPEGWEAVRVNYSGSPEDLGAALVAALARCSAREVFDVCFGTGGWSSWPTKPHHPRDPDHRVVTPDTIWESSWAYTVDAEQGLFEVREELDLDAPVLHRFRIGELRGDELGPAAFDPAELIAPESRFERTLDPERTRAVAAMLDALGLHGPVGVVTTIAPWNRHLHLPGRAVDLRVEGFAGASFQTVDGPVPMPEARAWWERHAALIEDVTRGLEVDVPPGAASWRMWSALFEALFDQAGPLDGPAPAYPRVIPPPEPLLSDLLAAAGGDVERLEGLLRTVALGFQPEADLEVTVDVDEGSVQLVRWYSVVESATDSHRQLSLADARERDSLVELGDSLGVILEPAVVAVTLRAVARLSNP